ncbi:AAA family ATPase [Psychrobacillus sp. NPDC093180]|uniref:AAA family ATPase n=1 Tax=Psychrobacillus sp. NPDC093180 TaxID=3364489 RepID=UPI003823F624
MNRLVILTVGKTHSGKTTFAKALETDLQNSVVIDQDNHAEFLHTYYENFLPKDGPNVIKHSITQTIVNYAINETDCHLILSNSNRNQKGRIQLLEQFHAKKFTTIIVNFNISDNILKERVRNSQRDTSVLRTALTFDEVLRRQQSEDVTVPIKGETDHLLTINHENEVQMVIQEIIHIANSQLH